MLLSIVLFLLGMVSLLLIVVVLIQDSKAGGLSTAFGGGGGDSVLGASGQTELAKFTVWLTVAFFILAVFAGTMGGSDSLLSDEPQAPGISSDPAAGDGGDTGGGDSGSGEGTGSTPTPDGDG